MSLLIKILIFFLPLVFWPSPIKFELVKVVFFLVMGFFLVIFLLTQLKTKGVEKLWQLDKTWFLWLGILFLSTLINQRFPYGFLAGGYRHQSVIFFLLLGLFATTTRKLKTKNIKPVLRWASVAIIIETLIIYCQWLALKLNFPILSYNQRPVGTIGEPNAVAGFLVMGLPIIINFLGQPLIPVLLLIIAVLLTGSKAGTLAVLAELIVLCFFWKKKFPLKKSLLTTCLLLVVLAGIFGVYLEKEESRFENRWLIWSLGMKAVQERPLLGYGAEGIIGAYEKQFRLIDRPLEGIIVDRAHNLFLDIALFSGLIGLAVFCGWLWQVRQRLVKNKHWAFISFVGFLVFSFFQPIGVTHWVYLMVLLSLGKEV